ncbi:hypothetical protein [Modestobacter sp. SYSU DS0875]
MFLLESGGVAVGCLSEPIEANNSDGAGGWLTNNDSDDGSTRIALDWKPRDWRSLTPAEAADLLGFLAKALAQYSCRQ